MEKQYLKTEDGKLQVTIPQEPVVTIFTMEYLKQQEASILQSLYDIRELIAAASDVGFKVEVADVMESTDVIRK